MNANNQTLRAKLSGLEEKRSYEPFAPFQTNMGYNIIGISAHFHDSACCLLQDGALVAAAQEERFSRRKHEPRIPKLAFKYCLAEGDITISDIDCIAYYEQPWRKLGRQIWTMLPGFPNDRSVLRNMDPSRALREIREVLGYTGPVHFVDHHYAHASSAFYYSGFPEAAILTVDGVGEWATTAYGIGKNGNIEIFESVNFPNSLGLFYSAITSYLGFSVNDGEYKVMGLAPYGEPKYLDEMRRLVQPALDGQYVLDLKYFDLRGINRIYSDELITLLDRPPRQKNTELERFYCDVASSAQRWLEEILLDKARYLQKRTGSEFLCMAGGVALNCVANGRIHRETPFKHLFVQPAANDAGGSLGAAAAIQRQLRPELPIPNQLKHAFWGPCFEQSEIAELIVASGLQAEDYRGSESEMLERVAGRLANGQVIGWMQGRMEFGPRALGARSILADPRRPEMRDKINSLVKKREAFRPFAPAVLHTRVANHFNLEYPSPFMLETCQVSSQLSLPAITHVDNSARVQTVDHETNPRFAGLLECFERQTQCPMLLNTSFNMNDEPIVCTPIDALLCFMRSNIDALVLGDFIIDRSAIGPTFQLLFRSLRLNSQPSISHRTYTLF